ncbi:hypothetical protein [Paenibacillus sp. Marseille-Q4541]|uniref:hypothetical protein n=1 Tax=Paenibacillus sp. Marseille-Q4541 TaxID=2831522 RepID=UPI001BAD13FD|nr:hypothetical protein [Paenibacillus sp. Marseille-Q4541]
MNQVKAHESKAFMYIHKYQEQVINSKSRPVILMALGQQSVTFVSDLFIPITSDLEIGLAVQDEHSNFHSFCTLKWKQEFGSFTLYHAFLHNYEEHRLYIKGQLNWMIHRMPHLYEFRPLDRMEEWVLIHNKYYNRIDTFI